MSVIPSVKLEREKRKSRREKALLDILSTREVAGPLVGVGGLIALQQLGKTRVINRDFAGALSSMWAVMVLAGLGVTDKYALGAASAAAAAAYGVATPASEKEAVVTIDLSSPLGGDGKLFFLNIPDILNPGGMSV